MTTAAPALILFAKTPQPGAVKTRLQPPLTAQQAAQVAELLIEQTVRLAQHWPGPVQLAVWPELDHPLFHRLVQQYGLLCKRQCEGDLGVKMMDAMDDFLQHGQPAAVLGCDVPHCPPAVLKSAAASLAAGAAVVGPASDGGYYFIGLNNSCPSLFHNIEWGTSQVLQQTLAHADACGVRFDELPMLSDLDIWADLMAARTTVPELSSLLACWEMP